MNNLTDLREQLQEDMIAYFSSFNHSNWYGRKVEVDAVCQIVVDRVTELQDKWDTPQELYPDGPITQGDKKLLDIITKQKEGN